MGRILLGKKRKTDLAGARAYRDLILEQEREKAFSGSRPAAPSVLEPEEMEGSVPEARFSIMPPVSEGEAERKDSDLRTASVPAEPEEKAYGGTKFSIRANPQQFRYSSHRLEDPEQADAGTQVPVPSAKPERKKPEHTGTESHAVPADSAEQDFRPGKKLRNDALDRKPNLGVPGEILSALRSRQELTFVEKLNELIRARGEKDSKIYKAAQIDRRLFSKIMSDFRYKPSKDTALALAYALELDLPEAEDLLRRAGFLLTHSDVRDIVLEYFFREHIYRIHEINIILDELGLRKIGR